MAKIDLSLIQELRTRTGLGMMDCRKALEESNGDVDKAIEVLRKKGAAVAAKRSDKETAQGIVHAYIHPGSLLGVLVEINCETDFVARTQDMQTFAKDLCMHIAAIKPLYLSPADVDPKFLEQIIEGKVKKLYSDICLLNQAFVKNDQLTIEDAIKELIAKTGENIKIRRFARFEIGA